MGHINSNTISTDWKRGKHLNFEERCSIMVFRKLKYSMRRITNELNCLPSTVMYELKKGTGERNATRGLITEYSAKRGQSRYEINRLRYRKHARITEDHSFVV